MVKRIHRSSDGSYHVRGRKYHHLRGSRAQVWHQTAHKTAGGLEKHQLVKNKHGRIVSRRKHLTAKREGRLAKHGWGARKGKFGPVRLSKLSRRRSRHSSSRRRRRHPRRRHRRTHRRRRRGR